VKVYRCADHFDPQLPKRIRTEEMRKLRSKFSITK
jgi:hypothetical protein